MIRALIWFIGGLIAGYTTISIGRCASQPLTTPNLTYQQQEQLLKDIAPIAPQSKRTQDPTQNLIADLLQFKKEQKSSFKKGKK